MVLKSNVHYFFSVYVKHKVKIVSYENDLKINKLWIFCWQIYSPKLWKTRWKYEHLSL